MSDNKPHIIDTPSPNHDARPGGMAVDMLIIHYTGMNTATEALERLCDPASKVSAHYLIKEGGDIHALVPEDRRAWHAGVSLWAGRPQVNDCSIGIELVNPGHEWGYRAFPDTQMNALADLTLDICRRYAIAQDRILGHSDVAPDRKTDPGELFDWRRLAKAGVGYWPHALDGLSLSGAAGGVDVGKLQRDLANLGYGLPLTGEYDTASALVVAAFQRRWHQSAKLGELDQQTLAIIKILLAHKR